MQNRAGIDTTGTSAEEAGVTRQTNLSRSKAGRHVASKIGGRYLILRSELERLIQHGDLT